MKDSPQQASDSRFKHDERGPSLRFWAIVVGLGCVSLFTVMWGASGALASKGSEKLLRIGVLFPKLKGNHGDRKADAFRMSEPEPSESAHPKERKTPAPPPPPVGAREIAAVFDQPKVTIEAAPLHSGPAPTTEPPRFGADEPGLQPIPRVELAPAREQCTDPVVFQKPCAPHRGDSPMLRNWKTLSMYSLLTTAAVVIVPQPVLAGDNKKPDPIEELKKSIDKLIERVGALETKKLTDADKEAIAAIVNGEVGKLGINDLRLEMLKQKALLEAYRVQIDELNKKILAGSGAPAVDRAFMEELKAQVKTLTDTIKMQNDTIAKLGPTKDRPSMYPSNGDASLGRVVIVNLYNEKLLFVVNGKDVHVPARTTATLSVPVGTLRYDVFASGHGFVDRQTVSLGAGETYTITATHPR